MNLLTLALILICAASTTARADDQPLPAVTPTSFFFEIGGGLDGRTSVTLKNGVLTTQFRQHAKVVWSVEKTPTEEAWKQFVRELNAAKLYRWSKDYPDPGVYDGCQWSINIEIAGRKIQSQGNNNYPVDGDEAQPTKYSTYGSPPLDRVCVAVSHLTGKEFK